MENAQIFRNKLKYIQPLYKLATLLTFAPPYNFDSGRLRVNILYKTYSLIVIGVHLYIYVFCATHLDYLKQLVMTSRLLHHITYIILLMYCSRTTMQICMGKRKTWKTFLEMFRELDNVLNIKYKNNELIIKTLLFIAYFLTISIFAYEVYSRIELMGLEHLAFEIAAKMQPILVFTHVLLMSNFAISIKYRFQAINEGITNIFVNNHVKVFFIKDKAVDKNNVCTLKEIATLYATASDLVDLFNAIFGWQIFMLFIIIFVVILKLFNLFLVYGFNFASDVMSLYSASLIVTFLYIVSIQF